MDRIHVHWVEFDLFTKASDLKPFINSLFGSNDHPEREYQLHLFLFFTDIVKFISPA